jgi:hypothetical protein
MSISPPAPLSKATVAPSGEIEGKCSIPGRSVSWRNWPSAAPPRPPEARPTTKAIASAAATAVAPSPSASARRERGDHATGSARGEVEVDVVRLESAKARSRADR